MQHIDAFFKSLSPEQFEKFKQIPTDELKQFLALQIGGADAIASNMNPEQAKALSGAFALSVLAEAGAEQGIEIKDLELRINLITGKSDLKCNGEKRSSKTFGTLEHYGKTLKPLCDEQATQHGMTKQENFFMKVGIETGFEMQLLGLSAEGSPIKFLIEPIKVIQFAMENVNKIA